MPNPLAFQQKYSRYDGPSESSIFFLLRQTRPNVVLPVPIFALLQGYYLRGVALHNLGEELESLAAFLQAVDLEDVNSPHMGRLTSNVASIVARLCPVPDKLLQRMPGEYVFIVFSWGRWDCWSMNSSTKEGELHMDYKASRMLLKMDREIQAWVAKDLALTTSDQREQVVYC